MNYAKEVDGPRSKAWGMTQSRKFICRVLEDVCEYHDQSNWVFKKIKRLWKRERGNFLQYMYASIEGDGELWKIKGLSSNKCKIKVNYAPDDNM